MDPIRFQMCHKNKTVVAVGVLHKKGCVEIQWVFRKGNRNDEYSNMYEAITGIGHEVYKIIFTDLTT